MDPDLCPAVCEPFDGEDAGEAEGIPAAFDRWDAPPGGALGGSGCATNLGDLPQRAASGKRIIICADGTWSAPGGFRSESAAPTNVWLLYRLIADAGAEGMPQLKYYHPGVGARGNLLRRAIDGATGRSVGSHMLDCYRFLVEHYDPGDHLYLFGFSRGAYTVRSLAGMIRNVGIIRRDLYPEAAGREAMIRGAEALYRRREEETAPSASISMEFRENHSHPDFCISCIGVWDTVGALGIPIEARWPIWWINRLHYGFHDVTLSAYVDFAFQALAIDEARGTFLPTLWSQQTHAREGGQVLRQQWFTGVHADIGGGYPLPERGLANITLRWMINQVKGNLRLAIATAPIQTLEGRGRPRIVLHDSMSKRYRLLNALGLTRRAERRIDDGLRAGGRRIAWRYTEEGLHGSVKQLTKRYETDGFPMVGAPYLPRNVASFLERHPPGTPPGRLPRFHDAVQASAVQ